MGVANRMGLGIGVGALALAALVGCRSRSGEGSEKTTGVAASAQAAEGAGSVGRAPEKARSGPRTTNGATALANLEAQIAGAEADVKANRAAGARREELIDLLLLRAEIVGAIGDYERALEVAEELVKAAPEGGGSYAARAQVRAALHRFEAAGADLDEASRRGARASLTRGTRASILAALGRYDEALALRREAREARPTLSTLGAEAAVLGEMGRVEEAARLFEEAPGRHRDVSPFPLAWLYLQEGLMWERAGDRARARDRFDAARERVPAYAHAASHLAAMEPYARGIELLRPVVERSDNPEYTAQLAELLRRRGDGAEADALLGRAKEGWDKLTERFPEAFADHAARFWLGAGGDRPKALALARRNAELRKTEGSLDLLLSAALAAGSEESACEAAREGAKLAYSSEVFRSMASSVAAKCPEGGRGAAAPRGSSASGSAP